MWDTYQSSLESVRAIVTRGLRTLPALAGECKLCHWRTACTKRLEELDAVRERYPGGEETAIYSSTDERLLYVLYEVGK